VSVQAQSAGGGRTHSQLGSTQGWVFSTALRQLYSRQIPGTHVEEADFNFLLDLITANI